MGNFYNRYAIVAYITLFALILLEIMTYDPTSSHLSDACTLKFGTWNCQGLSKIKMDIALKLDKDILCLTETHSWRDNENHIVYSDQPPKTDS